VYRVELESTGLAQHALIVLLEPIKALQHTLARHAHLALLEPFQQLRVNRLVVEHTHVLLVRKLSQAPSPL
jgi:hypothetical protein